MPSKDLLNNLLILKNRINTYKIEPNANDHLEITHKLFLIEENDFYLNQENEEILNELLSLSLKTEALWGLLLGQILWKCGSKSISDFTNIWAFSRYAAIDSKHSPYSAYIQLKITESFPKIQPGPSLYIVRGNALRQLQRYSESEKAYNEGIALFPENPFLKFRLVDLYLITRQLQSAKDLLLSLRDKYPFALEMMFTFPTSSSVNSYQGNFFPKLSANDFSMVWMVSADPIYINKYALEFARSISINKNCNLLLHIHIIRDHQSVTNYIILDEIKKIIPLVISERIVDLKNLTNNQKSAIFASERFLIISELLIKYKKPILVTDIDVQCLKCPMLIFNQIIGHDIGITKFNSMVEAWDLYPATCIFFKPTIDSINFSQRLAELIVMLINTNIRPWFVDQISLYRIIEENNIKISIFLIEKLLTLNDIKNPNSFLKIFQASSNNNGNN
jgi:hypothetical protein